MYATLQVKINEDAPPSSCVTRHEGVPTLRDMQNAVGGYIELALAIASPTRKNVTVDAYCNEEGRLIGLPVFFVPSPKGTNRGAWPVAGNLVVAATNQRTGKTVAATSEELDAALSNWTTVFG